MFLEAMPWDIKMCNRLPPNDQSASDPVHSDKPDHWRKVICKFCHITLHLTLGAPQLLQLLTAPHHSINLSRCSQFGGNVPSFHTIIYCQSVGV